MHKPKRLNYISPGHKTVPEIVGMHNNLVTEYNNLVKVVTCLVASLEEQGIHKIFFKEE